MSTREFRDFIYFSGISQIIQNVEIHCNSTNDSQLFRDLRSSSIELVQIMHL